MRVISFYSYKGGTGRTLLLANLATYAARLGRTVVMVDLDLEAPGLAYKFLPSSPDHPGVIEWLTAPRRPTVSEMAGRIKIKHPFNEGGALWLISAGRPPSQTYLREVRRLQSTAFADDSMQAVGGMLELRDAIESQLQPDLLLLDARTGISNTNAVTTRVLADDVVVLTLATNEQLEGTREVLRSLSPLTKPRSESEQLGLHVVVSRVTSPERGSDGTRVGDREQRIASEVRQFLAAPAQPLASTLALSDNPMLLHEDAEVAAEEHLLLAERSIPNLSRTLHFDYLRIAEHLWGADILQPAVAEAFRNINETQRLERAEFFGDVNQLLEAKAPPASAEMRPPTGLNRRAIKQKVELLRKTTKEDATRKPDLAAALIELAWASFDVRTRSTSNGLSFLREARRLYSDLAKEHPSQYQPAHLDVLIQYSAMAASLGQNTEALSVASEAVDAAQVQQSVPPELRSKALTNLAAIRHGVGQSNLAASPIRLATDILDGLLQAHPDPSSHVDLQLLRASAHNQRAIIEATLGNSALALRSAGDAVTVYRDLLKLNIVDPPVGLAGLGRSLNNLAMIYIGSQEFTKAVRIAELATKTLRDLAVDEPETYLSDLAAAYQTLSMGFADVGEHLRALETAEHAVHLLRDLVETSSGAHDTPALVRALINLAARSGRLRRHDEAVSAALEAVEVSRHAAEGRGEADEMLIERPREEGSADAWSALSTAYRDAHRPQEALEAAVKAREIYASLGKTHESAYLDLQLSIVQIYLTIGEFVRGHASAMEAIALAERLGLPTFGAVGHRLAARAKLRDDPATAIWHAQEAHRLSVHANDLTGQALSMETLADAHRAAGDTRAAAETQQLAAALRQGALTLEDPKAEG